MNDNTPEVTLEMIDEEVIRIHHAVLTLAENIRIYGEQNCTTKECNKLSKRLEKIAEAILNEVKP